jgi:hypothetical protein
MTGTIRGSDVALHPLLIARLFGARALCRCLWAVATGRRCTFLGVVAAGRRS